MHTSERSYRRFLSFEDRRARLGAAGDFLDPDDDRDDGEPVRTAEQLEELEAQDDAADLMKERCKRP
jgi:hypothetical protein